MPCWLPFRNSLQACFLKREYTSASWARAQGSVAVVVCIPNCQVWPNTMQAQEVRLSGLACKSLWDMGLRRGSHAKTQGLEDRWALYRELVCVSYP